MPLREPAASLVRLSRPDVRKGSAFPRVTSKFIREAMPPRVQAEAEPRKKNALIGKP